MSTPYLYIFRENPATGGGRLSFWDNEPSGSIVTDPLKRAAFWEDSSNLIPARRYTGCSATTMSTKGFKAIFIPDEQTGKNGIFVHQGSSSSHSDGCIVCDRSVVEFIYDRVPKNARNITIELVDRLPQPSNDW